MDKIITVLGYKNFITEMSDAPDCLRLVLRMVNVRCTFCCVRSSCSIHMTSMAIIVVDFCCSKQYLSHIATGGSG